MKHALYRHDAAWLRVASEALVLYRGAIGDPDEVVA